MGHSLGPTRSCRRARTHNAATIAVGRAHPVKPAAAMVHILLHAVSAIRETDECSRDAGRDEPEDRAANHCDAPTIAAFHAEDRSPLAAPTAALAHRNERRFARQRSCVERGPRSFQDLRGQTTMSPGCTVVVPTMRLRADPGARPRTHGRHGRAIMNDRGLLGWPTWVVVVVEDLETQRRF